MASRRPAGTVLGHSRNGPSAFDGGRYRPPMGPAHPPPHDLGEMPANSQCGYVRGVNVPWPRPGTAEIPNSQTPSQNAQFGTAQQSSEMNCTSVHSGGYLRCAQVIVNYTASGEASPPAAPGCACASIAYGVRRHVGYENPIARTCRHGAHASLPGRRRLLQWVLDCWAPRLARPRRTPIRSGW